ncbi:DUF2027 domain-containing protein [Saccharicrinis sp. FJH54]|uniref:DUF2027 domain-containing protein n=1 Tax=Saccharicrinis sp. FJH54 TaxID=3344665 RepID=UPI0035D464E4
MNIRVGDEIKYLNDVGGGKVIAIRDKKIAVILQDDGFEVPVLINECIKVESAEPAAPVRQPAPAPKKETYQYTEINSPESEQLNLLFAWIPEDMNSLEIDDIDLYLVNDSNYFCQFTCATTKGSKSNLVDHGVIEPNTKVLLESYEKRVLLEHQRLWINGQFFKIDKPFEKKRIVDFAVTLKPEKFEPKRFKPNDYFDEPAVINPIIKNDFYEGLEQLSEKSIENVKREKDFTPKKETKPVQDKNAILEVDLHINELLDDLSGLSNADILNYQMAKFREVLEANKDIRGKRIVFIHGIGNGTLKTELRKELDRKKMRHQDASFREYGFGATMVIL